MQFCLCFGQWGIKTKCEDFCTTLLTYLISCNILFFKVMLTPNMMLKEESLSCWSQQTRIHSLCYGQVIIMKSHLSPTEKNKQTKKKHLLSVIKYFPYLLVVYFGNCSIGYWELSVEETPLSSKIFSFWTIISFMVKFLQSHIYIYIYI